MKILQGQGVSQGIAYGPICFYRRTQPRIEPRRVADIAAEQQRLAAARQQAIVQLAEMAELARAQAGDAAAALFETHAMFLEDEDFVDSMDQCVANGDNAEYAVHQTGARFADMFAQLENSYMQARAADIQDVAERLIHILTGAPESGICSDVPVILAADDLAPSETIRLDKTKILAIATQNGSENSHTAILARIMGIPAVCGLGADFDLRFHNRQAFIVGDTGQLVFDPDPETLMQLEARRAQQKEMQDLLRRMVGQPDVTRDGRPVKLYCNIGSPDDVRAVQANDGQGIGLFRSEFLYLAGTDYPDEEAQFQAYRAVLSAMGNKPVTIRTLDIGADKQVPYFDLKKEENPAMGLRAIRICLERPEVFRTQLRALYRASAYGRLSILLPMIASVWEVKECRRACAQVMAELEQEGVPFDRNVPIGIMIETPAAVLMADELAPLVDFFSVGTNDLTQYTLACDRQCSDLGRFYDPHHPAVLRALKMAADAAHRAGIWIGICGELAADLSLLPTFLALGIDELSVSPGAVLPLRAAIREACAADCTLALLDG